MYITHKHRQKARERDTHTHAHTDAHTAHTGIHTPTCMHTTHIKQSHKTHVDRHRCTDNNNKNRREKTDTGTPGAQKGPIPGVLFLLLMLHLKSGLKRTPLQEKIVW